MNRSTMLAATLIVTAPQGAVLANAVAGAASPKVVRGSKVSMSWGPVQVSIRVSGRRIVSISATYPTDRRRSAVINGYAIPALRSEVLRAQSAKVHLISGATLTSRAYLTSLQRAITQAHV